MHSMTGYGRGECTLYNRKFVVEIKAVNHRYNDVTVKMPRIMLPYEDKLKKLIGSKVFRGKTDVYVTFETFSKDDVSISVNESVAESYIDALNVLMEKYGIDDSISLDLVAKFPDVISVEKGPLSENAGDEIEECLTKAAQEAIDNFVAMREREGEALRINILEKLEIIKSYVDTINERAPLVAEEYKARLTEKLNELEEIKADESRILTEVLIFSDKACIDEEITRMYSHIEQMRAILNETVPVGRKLDFLVQEMNREVNTMGSKSNDLKITGVVVDTKSELEKIREQIQNIE